MFGYQAGEERFKGVMNQFVVTTLTGQKRIWFILHTRGEEPVSVLMQELNKLVIANKIKNEQLYEMVYAINERETYTDSDKFQRVENTEILQWPTKMERTLISATNEMKASNIIGYVDVSDAG